MLKLALAGFLATASIMVGCGNTSYRADMQVSATVHGIELTNDDTMDYQDLKLTLNKSYYRHLRGLAHGSSTTLSYDSFLTESGFVFNVGAQMPRKLKVEVRVPRKYNVYEWKSGDD